jgi:hypothetical protein
MAHAWWHTPTFGAPLQMMGQGLGLVSDTAQNYLSGDLPSARSRPFVPGMSVNPITGQRMTPRQRIEMNKAARRGLLAPDQYGRVRPTKLQNFEGLPGSYVNPNAMVKSQQRERSPFLQDVASVVGPIAEAGKVGTNLLMQNVADPIQQYITGAPPLYQNLDTDYNFENKTKSTQLDTAKSLTGEGGVIDNAVQGIQNIANEQKQKTDLRRQEKQAERFRASKDPTAYSINDFKNDFPEIVQQGEKTVKDAYSEFRKNYKGGNFNEAKDAVTNKINQIKANVKDSTSQIVENKKKQKEIQNSPVSDEEKAAVEQETNQANQEIMKDTFDQASKSSKLSDLANNDMMLMAMSLLASAEKGEGTAEGLLNAMKAVQEANQGSTESLVTLTDPTTGKQKSYRRDDPAIDEAIAAGAVVRPMSVLDSLTFGALGQGMGATGEVDPQLIKEYMDANPDITRPTAEKEVRELLASQG